MNFAHPIIANKTAMLTGIYHLWWWITVHYAWLRHSFANHRHLRMWWHISELRSVLGWLLYHFPSSCPHDTICKLA